MRTSGEEQSGREHQRRSTPVNARQRPSTPVDDKDKVKGKDKENENEEQIEGAAAPSPSAPVSNVSEKKGEKPKKLKFADDVQLTREEFDSLVSDYGKDFTDKAVEILNNYKLSVGKKYKSDYRAVLNWVVGRVERDFPNLKKHPEPEPLAEGTNPYLELLEGT